MSEPFNHATTQVPVSLHKKLRDKLHKEGRSFNSFSIEAIARYCGIDPEPYLRGRENKGKVRIK